MRLSKYKSVATWFLVVAVAGACGGGAENATAAEIDAVRAELEPEVDAERVVDVIERCFLENGLSEAVVITDGFRVTIRYSGSGAETQARVDTLFEVCQHEAEEEYPEFFSDEANSPTTSQQYAVLYELHRRQAECLEGRGYQVNIPSLEVYTDSEGDWTPYSDVPAPPSQDEWDQLNAECPQSPWAYVDE